MVATVASGALTGIARIQQNGVWSNARSFTVPGGNGLTLSPNLLNMVVGDTHTIQALSSAGQPVTGLTWTSSDPTVVSMSTDDPPLLTALAAGHVTITAGAAAADVTVSADILPLGTVLWSVPGPGGDVSRIVPAVPSPTGVADVFAIHDSSDQSDPTVVQAITSDGVTAWTATLGPGAALLPDFQGGLVVSDNQGIRKLDGITGQSYPAYPPGGEPLAVHTDGTIFTVVYDTDGKRSVVGIDPISGAQKFSVLLDDREPYYPLEPPGNLTCSTGTWFNRAGWGAQMIVAGDGYAYVGYGIAEFGINCSGDSAISHVMLARIGTDGSYSKIPVRDVVYSGCCLPQEDEVGVSMISNGDTGVLVSWSSVWYGDVNDVPEQFGMAITNGTSLTPINVPAVSDQSSAVIPELQLQDGSFVGTVYQTNGQQIMIGFDASGSLRWSVPNEQPQIATADGGVIGSSGITYDQNGNAAGLIANLPAYSWLGYWYQIGSAEQSLLIPLDFALSFTAFVPGSPRPAAQGTAAKLVQSKTFMPPGGSILQQPDPTFPGRYSDQIKKDIPANKVAVEILSGSKASADGFLKALETTNSAVAFIGHAQLFNLDAYAICFGATSHWCLELPAVMNQLSPTGIGPVPGYAYTPLQDGFAPKAKVVFIGACGITDPFINQWQLGPNQALIVPVYLSHDAQVNDIEMDLYHAALEWEEMLVALAAGQNVEQAVAAGNAVLQPNSNHRWQTKGNGNATIR